MQCMITEKQSNRLDLLETWALGDWLILTLWVNYSICFSKRRFRL